MGSYTQRAGQKPVGTEQSQITKLTGVKEGRPGFSGTGGLGSEQGFTRLGKEPALEEQPLRKLSNRVVYAVLGSKQLAMAKEQVSVGIGEVDCGRQFYSFLGKLQAVGTYWMKTIMQFRS